MLIDLLVKGERMEASQFLRQHLNTARITKIGKDDERSRGASGDDSTLGGRH